jgi:acyl-CoA dehydrogenase
MNLVPSEEQRLLASTAREFVTTRSSLRRIRALRDAKDPSGFSRDLWKEMAGLGWTGIVLPEVYGGAGLGHRELAVVMEELGRGLVPEPMISTVLCGANAILLGGSDAQKRAILPDVATGEVVLAVAYQEPASRHDPLHVATRAERSGKGWKIRGEKVLVLDGHAADRVIVSARTSGETKDRSGITLFLVDPRSPGSSVGRQWLVDGRGAATVKLDVLAVGEDAVIGGVDHGGDVLERTIDRATVGLAAEMLGSMSAAFEMTLDYLKNRKQFGVVIGTFQALKHRAAQVYVEIELARSAVAGAAAALDEGAANAAELVSVAKARANDAFLLAANEAVQMHGGIGMTDEHDIGFFLKRARAAEMTFGDSAWHRERYAAIHRY